MRYWVWLHACLNYHTKHLRRIMEVFSTAGQLFQADEYTIRRSGLFTQREQRAVLEKNLQKADRIIERCRELGYRIVTIGEQEYPAELKKIAEPPTVLFYQGNYELANQKSVAIVGTREPSASGRNTAFEFGYRLAEKGFVIVSGGAEGIDSHAHKGALQSGGTTIGVLGGGLNHRYLPKNRSLREEIAQYGLLLSEYPPDMEPTSYTFPRRNRIISALAACTVVVEAGLSSGSLITASTAREQGKPLFAVPGDVYNYASAGTNALLVEGARAVVSYMDVLNKLQQTPRLEEEPEIRSETIDWLRNEGKRQHQEGALPERGIPILQTINWEEAAPKPMPEEQSEPEPMVKPEEQSEPEPEVKPEEQSKPESMVKPEEQSEPEPMVKPEEQSEPESEVKPEEDSEPKPTTAARTGMSYAEMMSRMQQTMQSEEVEKRRREILRELEQEEKQQRSSRKQTAPSGDDLTEEKPVKKKNTSTGKRRSSTKKLFNMNEKSAPDDKNEEKDNDFLKNMLTENALSVYHTISDKPIYVDLLKESVHLEISQVLSALTELELMGLIRPLPNGRYVRK